MLNVKNNPTQFHHYLITLPQFCPLCQDSGLDLKVNSGNVVSLACYSLSGARKLICWGNHNLTKHNTVIPISSPVLSSLKTLTNTRLEELCTNSCVSAHSMGHLWDIGPCSFTYSWHGIDTGDPLGQEGIGSLGSTDNDNMVENSQRQVQRGRQTTVLLICERYYQLQTQLSWWHSTHMQRKSDVKILRIGSPDGVPVFRGNRCPRK